MTIPEMSASALVADGEHVVVVVTHPDDESFGCASLIALAVATGATVTVICATRGEAGERRPDATTDHLPLDELRLRRPSRSSPRSRRRSIPARTSAFVRQQSRAAARRTLLATGCRMTCGERSCRPTSSSRSMTADVNGRVGAVERSVGRPFGGSLSAVPSADCASASRRLRDARPRRTGRRERERSPDRSS